ncbi:hypothetical protein ACHQM5_024174 [Ranunculus cassubicifolius]
MKDPIQQTQQQIEKKRTRKRKQFIPRIGCFKIEDDYPTSLTHGGFSMEMESDANGQSCEPTHLVVMVNGIIGSAADWKYTAKQFLIRYPHDIVVHCSERNSSMMTFDGVDIMGERLAEEVTSLVNHRPKLQKISFVAHSLGGLVARYAIGRLYRENITKEPDEGNGDCAPEGSRNPIVLEKLKGKIAGLEPINFITIASPHLGSRGHKQFPAVGTLRILEKLAHNTSWMLSKTGRHLMLTDKKNGKPPLLLRMVNDSEDLKFMSALHSFRRRVAYANSRFDFVVGWRTASIRRKNELPKLERGPKDNKYPHIVNVEPPKTSRFDEDVTLEDKVKKPKTSEMEEFMIKCLTRVGWERVDVSFRGSRQRFFAHNTIQVKSPWMNSDGADVILHVIDHFLL